MLRRSNIGLIGTHRSVGINGGGANSLLGVDANFFLLTNLTANAFYAKTQTSGRDEGTASLSRHVRLRRGPIRVLGRAPVDRPALRSTGRVRAANRFPPQLRGGTLHAAPEAAQPGAKYTFLASMDYVTDVKATVVQDKELRGYFQTEFQNSDQYSVEFLKLVPN